MCMPICIYIYVAVTGVFFKVCKRIMNSSVGRAMWKFGLKTVLCKRVNLDQSLRFQGSGLLSETSLSFYEGQIRKPGNAT